MAVPFILNETWKSKIEIPVQGSSGAFMKIQGLILTVLSTSIAGAQPYVVSTFAGGNPPPTPVAGVQASIGAPRGVTADHSGNVYFTSLNCLFKLDAAGTLTRVAGNARAGYAGDGGPATAAQFNSPAGVAMDAAGSLYIADPRNMAIRKVDTQGVISTDVGGNSFRLPGVVMVTNPSGVSVDAAGNQYMADAGSNVVWKRDAQEITTVAGNGTSGYAGDGGPATNARLNAPAAAAADANGNLYIADTNNHCIRKVNTQGIIATVAGTGTYGYSGDGGPATSAQIGYPYGIALDTAGNLYFSDGNHARIRKVDTTGKITTVAGNGNSGFAGDGGPATSAQIGASAHDVAVDAGGNLYIADGDNSRIRKVDTTGKITTVAGNGSYGYSGDDRAASVAQLGSPAGAAVDSGGNVYIADTNDNRIRKVDTKGIITTVAGNGINGSSGDGGPAAGAQLGGPFNMVLDASGNLYIADTNNLRVRKIDAQGNISTVAGNGLYGFSGDGGPATSAKLTLPLDVAAAGGNLYIADEYNYRVRKVDNQGNISTLAGTGVYGSSGDGGPATSAQLSDLTGVAVDAAGNVYIADYGNNRIRKVDTKGIITTVAGNGNDGYSGDGGPATGAQLNSPSGVTVDAGGNLYIADFGNNRIRKVDTQGFITTVAGSGAAGDSGDGSAATSAQVFAPGSLCVDANGKIYFTDQGSNAIRLLTPSSSTAPSIALVANAEGESPAIAPNTWVEIKGSNLAPAGDAAGRIWSGADFVGGQMPAQLDGVSVTVNGKKAFVYYVSPVQVNILTPPDSMSGDVTVQLTNNGAGASYVAPAEATSNSLFQYAGSYALATHLDGSLIGPSTLYPGTTTPVKPGETFILYGNGFGPVSAPLVSGSAVQSGTLPTLPEVQIGNLSVTASWAGLASPGLFQFNVTVPLAAPDGNSPITATYASYVTQSGLTIAVHH